jgi:hypothetical protein
VPRKIQRSPSQKKLLPALLRGLPHRKSLPSINVAEEAATRIHSYMLFRAYGAMFGAVILASFMMGLATHVCPVTNENLAGFLDKRPGSAMHAAFVPSSRLPWSNHAVHLLKSQEKMPKSRLSELGIAHGPSFLSMTTEAKKKTIFPRKVIPPPEPVARVRRHFKQVSDDGRYFVLR